MAELLTAELMLKLNSQGMVKDLEDALLSGVKHATNQSQKMISDAFREAVIDGITDGRTGDAIKSLHKSGVIDAQQQYTKLIKEIESTKDDAQKKRLTQQAVETKKLLDQRSRSFKREMELQRKGAKEQRGAGKSVAEGLESGTEGLISALRGGPMGLARGARGLARRFEGAGEGRIAKAREMGMGGADTKQVAQMAKMGQTLAKVGAALGVVAAVAGAVILLVKLFMDLESRAKDMNKALLEGAGAADFGLGHVGIVTGELNERLSELRAETADLNDAFFDFGALAKEQQGVLVQLNQAGFTYAKMTEGLTTAEQRAEGYANALNVALTYSRALGVSSTEMARTMGQFTLETGEGLQEIGEQFSVITNEAMRAGFTTKRFYAAVVEATSGMAFYGVRLEETTKLLASFDSLLGETVGAEAFKRLVGQYRDADEKKKLTDIIMKGEGFVAKELGRAFELRIQGLQDDFGKRLGGVDVAEMLASMTQQELREKLEGEGLKPTEIRRLVVAKQLEMGRGGDRAQMMEAMGVAGKGFDIAMAMNASRVFQGRNVGEVAREARGAGERGVAMRAALAEVTGKSGADLTMLIELFEAADARWANLERIQEEVQKNEGDLLALSEKDQKYLQEMSDRFGIEISTLGEEITKDGSKLKEAMDLVRTGSADTGDKLKDQFTKDQQIAMGISENIYGLSEIMEQTIAKILNDIYGVVAAIARKFLAGGPELGKIAGIEEAKKAREEKQLQLAEQREKIRAVDVKLRTAEGTDREKLLEERKNLVEEQKKVTKDLKMAEVVRKELAAAPAEAKALEVAERAKRKAGFGPKGAAPTVKGLEVTAQMITGQKGMEGQRLETTQAMGMLPWDIIGAEIADATSEHRVISGIEDITPADILEDMRANFDRLNAQQREDFTKLYGGEENIEKAFQAAAEAMKGQAEEIESIWIDEATEYKKFMGVGGEAFKTSLALVAGTGIAIDAVKAQDLILPAGGGRPIITDPSDTLMAFKPGGPLSQALSGGGGGGRGGTVNVNIYGGDQKKIYDTIMRVLKATGNA